MKRKWKQKEREFIAPKLELLIGERDQGIWLPWRKSWEDGCLISRARLLMFNASCCH